MVAGRRAGRRERHESSEASAEPGVRGFPVRATRLETRRATLAECDAARQACPRATLFRSRAWAAYYAPYDAIHEGSLARWGGRAGSRFGPANFEALRHRGAPEAELRLAELDDATIFAGGFYVYGPRHASCGHAAALADFFEPRVANWFAHELTLDACVRSLEWLDLDPNGGRNGVQRFNGRVGAVALPSPAIAHEESLVGGREPGGGRRGRASQRKTLVAATAEQAPRGGLGRAHSPRRGPPPSCCPG